MNLEKLIKRTNLKGKVRKMKKGYENPKEIGDLVRKMWKDLADVKTYIKVL